MNELIPHSAFRISSFLKRLFNRRRAEELGQLAQTSGAAAAPLTITEVRHPEFSATLPGVWLERRRTREACELTGPDGSEGLTISVRKMAITVPAEGMAELCERLLGERQRLVDEAAGATADWTAPEISRQDRADHNDRTTQARCDGYAEPLQMRYALLERVGPDKVLSAALWTRGSAGGGPAFSNRATIIFDRIDAG